MIWSLSWRNVWRNRLRSGVVITAVGLGVFAGVFSMAFMQGMADDRLESAIRSETSHIQVHHPAFLDVNDMKNYFTGSDSIIEYISGIESVSAVSRRLIINSIISSAETGSGIRLVGVEKEREIRVTNISEKLVEGNYLDSLKRGRPILIGRRLAEKLKVGEGSKLVVGLLDIEGQPMYYQFRVTGIFRTASAPFDESTCFVNFHDLTEITHIPPGAAHEIAVYASGEDVTERISAEIRLKYPGLSVMEWDEIMPELGYITSSMNLYMYLFVMIILLALGFGIVNTMLMVVLERIKELGMLMAVGMNKVRVFKMIMLETVFLSITGGVAGIILGSGVSLLLAKRGMDLSSLYKEGFEAIGWSSVIYPSVNTEMLIVVCILVIITGILASVYPALKALKLNPSEAIRTDN